MEKPGTSAGYNPVGKQERYTPSKKRNNMAAPKGNQFWKKRSSHGKSPIFKTSDDLWKACVEYFEWAEAHPLKEEKLFHFQGEITTTEINKMRAMTIDGLCLFLDISDETWRNYRGRQDYVGIVRKAEKVIRSQKFAGAAADLLNANIIARDLGLKDNHEHTGRDGESILIKVIHE